MRNSSAGESSIGPPATGRKFFGMRLKFLHPSAPQLNSYALGDVFTGGAELAVYLPKTELTPLQTFRGPGRLAGTLSVLQFAQSRVPFQAGVAGIPTISGQFISQPLAPTPDGNEGS